MAYIPEGRSIFPGLSTADNLRLGKGGIERAVTLIPQLEVFLNRKAGLLSGGEQQCLTVARALAREPAVLLADELSLGLAPMVVDRLLTTIRDAANNGMGVVLVEQHVRSALAIADRVCVLRRGQIVMTGTPEEMLARDQELVASYLSATGSDGSTS
jgi:branched-chain amino acid transport system ATP-binding protein